MKLEDLDIGLSACFSKTISEADVYMFAGISGDFNPIHTNREEAKRSIFQSRIVHGVLLESFLSNVIGTKMPGPGTIYMEQKTKFLKPVFINDTVTAEVKVEEIIDSGKGIVKLRTVVKNQTEDIVIDGYAIVKVPVK